jgi:ATP-dependent Lon protease
VDRKSALRRKITSFLYPNFKLISEDNFNIQNVKKLLDNEHFGLDDVKERILEFVSVGIMKKNLKEKILLLHGPPGVGKTSLAISIAK